jgi:hypothetical protein
MKKTIAMAICLWSACLFAQDGLKRDPRELVGVLGKTTITDKVRELRLPDKAKLLGVFDWDRDGRAAYFLVLAAKRRAGSAGGSPAGVYNCQYGRISDEPECEIVFSKHKFHYWLSSAGEPPALPAKSMRH